MINKIFLSLKENSFQVMVKTVINILTCGLLEHLNQTEEVISFLSSNYKYLQIPKVLSALENTVNKSNYILLISQDSEIYSQGGFQLYH